MYSESARWELNPRPASYKDAALTVELRASESRAGGNRTHSGRLKVCCAAFTPRPHEIGRACAFQSLSARHRCCSPIFLKPQVSSLKPFASGSPEDRTQRDPVISRIGATSPRLPSSRAPRSRTETLLLPKQACSHLHLCPNVSQNGWIRTSVLLPPRQARYQTSLRSDEVPRRGIEPLSAD